jgi:hypothetical protein
VVVVVAVGVAVGVVVGVVVVVGPVIGIGVGRTGGGLFADSPEAGEAGELEAGDSTICNRF